MNKQPDRNPLLIALPTASKSKHIFHRIRAHKKRVYTGAFVFVFSVIGVALLTASRAAVAVSSVQSGPWSAASTWSGGRVPQADDFVTIESGHSVTFDVTTSPKLGETQIKGTLTFDPNKSTKLVTNRNLVVTGKLVMKPASTTVEHFINFVEINEQAFVGGGMDVLASDVGMWVMGDGQLDIAGSPKKSWTNLSDSVSAGATSITLKEEPTGWQAGDTIFITPTEAPTAGAPSYQAVEERTITSISGNSVSFAQGLSRAHPKVNGKWTAEVGNLKRNVRIEGTYRQVFCAQGDYECDTQNRHEGNSHIFIRSTKPQNVSHTQLRYMGTAGLDETKSSRDQTANFGRYPLHFHHMGDASRGSIVDDVVVRDSNFHAFVPHASNGITMKNSIAYKVKAAAFWWDSHDLDPTSDSHDSVWDRNLVSVLYPRVHESAGFFLPAGHNNKVTNSSVAGVQENFEQGGYFWVNNNHGVWGFDNNISHNNADNGMTVWQNASALHPVGNFAVYHNQYWGISHGAYVNDYHYFDGEVYGNLRGGLSLQANSRSPRQSKFERMVWDGAGISPNLVWASHSALEPGSPTLFHDNVFKGYKDEAILMHGIGSPSEASKQLDFVNSTFEGSKLIRYSGDNSDNPNNRIRVQPKVGQPYQVKSGNVTSNIAPFAATEYGTGRGLLAEYFTGNFATKTLTRLEPSISQLYADNEEPAPYWINPWHQNWTARWTGEFQAQFSEPYTFLLRPDPTGSPVINGGRVWINNQLVLDAWDATEGTMLGTPIQLVKGQKYAIRVEMNIRLKSTDILRDTQEFHVYLQSPSQYQTVLPMSQLYCGTNPACDINSASTPPTTPNPTPTPAFPAEDINQDGHINLLDFSILASKYGQTTNLGRADINSDGTINLLDFSILATKFGT